MSTKQKNVLYIIALGLFATYSFSPFKALAYDPDIRATMTSNTAPSGYVADGSCAYTGINTSSAAYKVFDGLYTHPNDYYFQTSCNNFYELPSAKILTAWGWLAQSSIFGTGGSCPSSITISGSNNGSSWTTLDTESGLDCAGSSETDYSISNTTAYTYYAYSATSHSGSYVVLMEVYYYGVTSLGGGGGGGYLYNGSTTTSTLFTLSTYQTGTNTSSSTYEITSNGLELLNNVLLLITFLGLLIATFVLLAWATDIFK